MVSASFPTKERNDMKLRAVFAVAIASVIIGLGATPASSNTQITLTLIHNNDGESAMANQTVGTSAIPAGNIAAFATVMKNTIRDARRSKNSVLSVYAGDSFLASATLTCSEPSAAKPTKAVYDAVAQAAMPYDVHVLGNHEFDFGTAFLARYIKQFGTSGKKTHPFISGNLDFSKNADLKSLYGGQILERGKIKANKVLGASYIHVDPITKQKFGVVSAITEKLPTISSPGTVRMRTADLTALAANVQAQVNALTKRGINKIILVSHLQSVTNDRDLIQRISGVDVAVAGGGDDLLASPSIADSVELLPGEATPIGNYPFFVTDKTGNTVPLVTTVGNYKYVGRFDATFDSRGRLTGYNAETSFPRRVIPVSSAATAAGISDAVALDKAVLDRAVTPVDQCLTALGTTPIAKTEVVLNRARGSSTTPGVRTVETNAGNFVTDSYLYAYSQRAAAYGFAAASTTNPVIAIQNGGGIRQNGGDNVPSSGTIGNITRLDTLNMMAFDNQTGVVTGVTPADLKAIFETSCSASAGGWGGFLQVAGMKLVCSRSGVAQVLDTVNERITTPGSRVQSIQLADGRYIVQNGAVVAGAPNVSIVSNTFTMYAAGDGYFMFRPYKVTSFGWSYEESVYYYLLSQPKDSAGLPTIAATDKRYAIGGEGRITWTN
jgi:5'-nucleotidase